MVEVWMDYIIHALATAGLIVLLAAFVVFFLAMISGIIMSTFDLYYKD